MNGDAKANVALVEQLCREEAAKSAPVDAIVFPEVFLQGYNIGADLHRLAEPVDGPSAQVRRQLFFSAPRCRSACLE